ncbi:MAG: AgmX/PglI C-terminal domain-containing protein [Polyangiales bacterium]
MTHSPKWRALIAFNGELLSVEGNERVERHLQGCDVCLEALAEIRAFDEVAHEVRESPVDVDFARMELALRREAKSIANRQRAKRGLPFVLAAAAVALFIGSQLIPSSATPVAVNETPDVVETLIPEPESPSVAGVVVALAGEVGERGLGAAVAEDEALSVDEGSLHVLMPDGSAFALSANSRVQTTRLREDELVLTLEEGRVTSDVRTGRSYYVDAPPYRIRVQGTRFEVRRDGEQVAVTLDEGIVEVLEGDTVVRHMEAPDRWSSHEGFEAAAQGEVLQPHVDGLEGAALELAADENIVRWEVGGLVLRGAHAAVMTAPGDYEVVGFDANDRRYEAPFALLPEGGHLEGSDLRAVRRAPRGGYLPPEAISEVVRPSYRALQRCYERELRQNNPSLRGDYALRVSVDREGAVSGVRVTTDSELPPPLRNCLARTAQGWAFPAPRGGALTFELPLNFSARPR